MPGRTSRNPHYPHIRRRFDTYSVRQLRQIGQLRRRLRFVQQALDQQRNFARNPRLYNAPPPRGSYSWRPEYLRTLRSYHRLQREITRIRNNA